MILTDENILAILQNDPNRTVIEYAQQVRNDLFVHVFGVGLDDYIKKINSFENEDQYNARLKYARSNRDIMERLIRPVDKIFSANGGSTYYNLPKNDEQRLRNYLQNTENGLPLRKWIEQYWKPAYLADPMGLILIEIDKDGNAYPTYKGSNEIKTYQLNGRHLDYVIFNVEDRKDRFRVVDDARDFIIEYNGKEVKEVENETFINYFGHVPAIINSDLPVLGQMNFESPLQKIVEIANEYLRECSVKSIYKLLHGFPKYWEYQSICPECKGTGNIAGEKCTTCNGTGIKLKMDVSDIKRIPLPTENDKLIAPNIAGYIVPPIDTWTRMNEELKDLESLMFQTLWGTKQLENAENETATGRFIDTQPVNDRLSKFSDAAEIIETYITDNIASLYFPNYKGASISYGRRFQIESPDVLWTKYESARSSGAPLSALDDMLKEYLQSKFENHSIELQKQVKLMELEPFVHFSAMQVQTLNITDTDKAKKMYYEEFVRMLQENEILYTSVEVLNERLTVYAQEKANQISQQIINNNNNNIIQK